MANIVYPKFKGGQSGKAGLHAPVDFDTDTIKIALVTSTYITGVSDATKKTQEFYSDLTGEVASGGGYTTGGNTLGSVTLTASGDNYVFDAADAVWTTATITARGAVIYKSTGTGTTSPLICVIDFGSDITSTAADFTVVFDVAGILSFQ